MSGEVSVLDDIISMLYLYEYCPRSRSAKGQNGYKRFQLLIFILYGIKLDIDN